jgi:hypothetical protein
MTAFGAQVAIVDDKPEEVYKIQENLTRRNVGFNFYDASPEKKVYPEKPMESIETVFLDLHYGERGLKNFDPFSPAQWISKLIPKNHKYFLVAWTLDTDDFISVLSLLSELNIAPYAFFSAQKNDYQIEGNDYDVEKLLNDIEKTQENIKNVEEIPGQIIALEEDKVLIKCRVSKDKPIFQVRRFDLELFNDSSLKPELNGFINIQITTEPGIRTIEIFSENNSKMKELFEIEDYFKDFTNSKFIGNNK